MALVGTNTQIRPPLADGGARRGGEGQSPSAASPVEERGEKVEAGAQGGGRGEPPEGRRELISHI